MTESDAAQKPDHTITVLLCGVGGQGTILAGDLLALAATASGLDVKVSEIHGMAQRGGAVSTIVRFGSQVASPVTDPGFADRVVAFESTEALRNLPFLAPEGHLLVNDNAVEPLPVLIGQANMPADAHGELQRLGATLIDATGIAQTAGNPKGTNVVLMGALSAVLPFSVEIWHDVIAQRVPPKTVEANIASFDQGRAVALDQITTR